MRVLTTVIIAVLIISITAMGVVGYFLFEGTPPRIVSSSIPEVIGPEANLAVSVMDKGTGLTNITVEMIQDGKTVTVMTEDYPKGSFLTGSSVKEREISASLDPKVLGLKQGKAVLLVRATDGSLRNGFSGNSAILKAGVQVDIVPPAISVLSSVHNVRVGGSAATSYRLGEEVTKTGILVDEIFFPACQGKDGIWRCLWGIPYNIDRPSKVVIFAVDQAGNRSEAGFVYRVLPRRKIRDKINISQGFLQSKIPGFLSAYPELAGGTDLDIFLKINRELRQENNQFLLSLSSHSADQPLWHGAFIRFKGAPRANFADHRTYYFKGKAIDRADHMGVDIASVARARVPAANSGIVLFAGYNGIYGNTVVIDHGLGLLSLYAHLSSMAVKKGDAVEKGEVIGRSGTTGLAGGDHLHFGMIISSIFVNPREWWDSRWIASHIEANLNPAL